MSLPNFSHRLLTSVSEITAISSEIERLLETQQASTFFHSSTWLSCWCEHYLKSTDELCFHAFYQNSDLVGFAPFYVRPKGFGRGAELHMLGEGEAENIEVSSEYPELPSLPSAMPKIFDVLSEWLLQRRDINQIVFKRLLNTSKLASWLESLDHSWETEKWVKGNRFQLDVCADQITQISCLKQSTLRRQARQWRKRAQDISVEKYQSKSEIRTGMQQLSALHQESWKLRGRLGVFSEPTFSNFHQQFSQNMGEQDRLCLFAVLWRNQVVAVFYGWAFGDTLFYYQSGIKRLDSAPGAGVLMHLEAINIAREMGLMQYDLMQGREESYKAHYVTSGAAMIDMKSSRGNARLEKKVVEQVKQWLGK